jgi:hypothetical protein
MSDDWETCKENVQPIKRGRAVNALVERLAVVKPSMDLEESNKKKQEYFEEIISKAKKSAESGVAETEDRNQVPGLLECYLLYFKWVRDSFPSSSEKALAVLEQATCDMKDDARLKNDTRFVKLWIEYVRDTSPSPALSDPSLL